MIQLRHITAEFLPDSQGCGIHKMRPSDLYHMHILLALRLQGISELFDTRDCRPHQHFVSSDMHGRWESVVR